MLNPREERFYTRAKQYESFYLTMEKASRSRLLKQGAAGFFN